MPKPATLQAEGRVAHHAGIEAQGRPADKWLLDSLPPDLARQAAPASAARPVRRRRARSAEAEAIDVFGDNLKDLLLAAPAGPKAVLGLDPGLRTGVKVAVVDRTGKLVATDTIYPHEPRKPVGRSRCTRCARCA